MIFWLVYPQMITHPWHVTHSIGLCWLHNKGLYMCPLFTILANVCLENAK
jgi:hypothetical protein